MTADANKAWNRICEEFIQEFLDFISDVENVISESMTEYDFGRKYGFTIHKNLLANHTKKNLTNLTFFQKNVSSGRYTNGWKKAGYDMKDIYELKDAGLLSYRYNYGSHARMTGRTDFYFISQETAKKIFKEYKESVKA